jgi:hypothetical protein
LGWRREWWWFLILRGAEEGHDFGTRTVLELLVRGERGCRIGEGTLGVHVSKRWWVVWVRVLLGRVRGCEGEGEVLGPSGGRIRRGRDLLEWKNHEVGRKRA